VGVSQELTPVPNVIFPTLVDAITAWNTQCRWDRRIIAILDSRTYREN